MLSLCQEKQVPIIVNTDAHFPTAVGNFDLAYQLLEQLDFDEALILNNDLDKFKAFLGRK